MKKKKYDYKELDRYVKAYQAGDNEAGLKIIEMFEGFLTNFLVLIKNGTIDIKNSCLRNFLFLYMSSREIRRDLKSYKHSYKVQAHLYATAHLLSTQFARYDEEEIRAELVAELLIMAKRYKNDIGPFFHTYVLKAYHYRIFKRLMSLINDPTCISMHSLSEINIDDLYEETNGTDELLEKLVIEDKSLIMFNNEEPYLDENWINGFTCSNTFTELTTLERRILVMYYIDKLKDREIGEKLGLSQATVRKSRHNGLKYLKNMIL